jgi:membrane protease YdiL (CAAX protease family)
MRWWDGTEWSGHTSALISAAKPWFPQENERDEEQGIRGGGIALVAFFGSFLLSLVLVVVLVALDEPGGPLVTLAASAMVLWTGDWVACRVAVRRHGSGSLRDLGLTKITRRDIGVGLLAGLIARVGTFVLAVPFVLLFPDDFKGSSSTFGQGIESGLDTALVLTAVAVIGAPFFEELFFRGLVQSVLTRRWGVRTAVSAQAVLFALVHLINPDMSLGQYVLTFVTIAFTGLVLGAVRWRYNRLGPGIVAHASFNVVAVVVILAVA